MRRHQVTEPERTGIVGADGRTYDQWLAAREQIANAELEVGQSYDKHLLALASGALGVSILFVEKIAINPQWTLLLFTSWSLFGIAMACCLLAMLMAQATIALSLRMNDALYQSGNVATILLNVYAKRVVRLNWFAFATFLSGVVTLVAFAIINQRGAILN